ncbi:MAG: CRISPR-associated protein Cas4 [Rhodobacteraceae bacterium]|nr:CRISPR-associated protein Cas4 [Paracoccaceae bacterium]
MSRSDPLPLSALQHWLFCPRQCALIHVEQLWAENRLTAEGRVLHTTPDAGQAESHGGKRILRAVHLASDALNVHGVADVVELLGGRPYPVEYKRGRPKQHRADEVQLCAQAICLEEMTGHDVPEGALFYGQNRRRKVIRIDSELRTLTRDVAKAANAAMAAGQVPAAVYRRDRCGGCSLRGLCRPEARRTSTATWMSRLVTSGAIPE